MYSVDVLIWGLLSHLDLWDNGEVRVEMCRSGRDALSPLTTPRNLWDYSRPRLTAQLSFQKRGEALFLLMTFGSQAGGS